MQSKTILSFYPSRKIWKVIQLFALMMIFTIHSIAGVTVQGKTVKINESKISLSQLIKKIENQVSAEFIYKSEDLREIKNLKVEKEGTVTEVLNSVLEGTGLELQLKGGVYVISKKAPVVKKEGRQEKKELKGKVIDEDGKPLPGVSVVIKGTSVGVATNIDGGYVLMFADANISLVYSFIGMKSQEIAYTGQSVINVTLLPDFEQMSEVVVTGYQTISKERVTGSFDKVSKVQLNKPTSSAENLLIGTVAGLHRTVPTGNAGETSPLQIRGKTSLGTDPSPLVVVDGFAISGSLESINPNDIESITVLKDAAASSIWGARSANGVIVVTTKKGHKGKMKVEVSSWVKLERKMDLDYANPVASSSDVIDYEQMGFDSKLFGSTSNALTENFFDYNSVEANGQAAGTYYSSATIAMNEHRLGFLTEAEKNATLAKLRTLNNKKQIKDHLLASPCTQQHNITISGGSDKISNTLSLLFEDGNSYFKGNDSEKYKVNYRSSMEVTDWLDFNFSGSLQSVSSNFNGVRLIDIQNISPFDMLLNEDGSYKDVQHGLYMPLIDRFVTKIGAKFPYENWAYNPIQEMRSRDKHQKNINSRIQAGLKFKILEGLTFDTKFQYELRKIDYKGIYNEDSYEVRYNVNQNSAFKVGDPNSVDANYPKGQFLDRNASERAGYNVRNQLSFDRTYGKHAINMIAGTEVSKNDYYGVTFGRKFGFVPERLAFTPFPHGSAGKGNRLKNMYGSQWSTNPYKADRQSSTAHRDISMYGNLAYTYNDKYTFSGSYRTDASNLISTDPSIRYSPFWSVGGGWQISKEEFMKDLTFVDRLNLRATYGYNGNVKKGMSMDPTIGVWPWGDSRTGTMSGYIASYGNPKLSWERTGAFDLGLDFSLFRGKLFGKLDLYNKKGTNLISQVTLAQATGATSSAINAVEMYNRGIEISIGTKLPIHGDAISWTGNLNFAYNKNKITKLYKNDATLQKRMMEYGSSEYVEGYDSNTQWGLIYGGMHNFGTEVNPDMRPSIVSRDGKQHVDFSVGSPSSFNNKDFVFDQGTKTPPVTMGFVNLIKIYDFDLSFIMTGYFGHVFRRKGFDYNHMSRGKANINVFYKEVVNGDPNKILPIPTKGSPQYSKYKYFADVFDYNALSADNIRIEEINLTYHMPKKALNRIGLQGLSLYAQANNVGVIAFNKHNQDPVYPKGRIKPGVSYTFGCKFNF